VTEQSYLHVQCRVGTVDYSPAVIYINNKIVYQDSTYLFNSYELLPKVYEAVNYNTGNIYHVGYRLIVHEHINNKYIAVTNDLVRNIIEGHYVDSFQWILIKSTDGISWSRKNISEPINHANNVNLLIDRQSNPQTIFMFDRYEGDENDGVVLYALKSVDEGETFTSFTINCPTHSLTELCDELNESDPEHIYNLGRWISPTSGIQLSNGVLAFPLREGIRQLDNSENFIKIYAEVCRIIYSADNGVTWQFSPSTPAFDENDNIIVADESVIVEYKTNEILINSRGGVDYDVEQRIINHRRVFTQIVGEGSWSIEGWNIDETDNTMDDISVNASIVKATFNGQNYGLFAHCEGKDPQSPRHNMMLYVAKDFKNWTKIGLVTPFDLLMEYGYPSLDFNNGTISLMYDAGSSVNFVNLTDWIGDEILTKLAANSLLYE
jgi:hypothetical protein